MPAIPQNLHQLRNVKLHVAFPESLQQLHGSRRLSARPFETWDHLRGWRLLRSIHAEGRRSRALSQGRNAHPDKHSHHLDDPTDSHSQCQVPCLY
jgi:hypothetical protein